MVKTGIQLKSNMPSPLAQQAAGQFDATAQGSAIRFNGWGKSAKPTPTPQPDAAKLSDKACTPKTVKETARKPKMSWWTKALIACGAVLPIAGVGYYATRPVASAPTVQTANQQKPVSNHTSTPVSPPVSEAPKLAVVAKDAQGHVAIDEVAIPFVDKASDIPYLNRQLDQNIVDLARNPLLSLNARQQIEQMLRQFNNASGKGKMQVVVIANSHQRELNTLATDIMNQLQIGEAGKNDGLLLLLNAANLRAGTEHADIHLVFGDGVDQMTQNAALDLLKEHAFPHIKNQNYDQAVTETVRAVQTMLKGHTSPVAKPGQQVSDQVKIGICITAIMVLLLALALSADVAIYKGRDFPFTALYIRLSFDLVMLMLQAAAGGKGGGGGGGSSGGSRGGFGSGRGAGR